MQLESHSSLSEWIEITENPNPVDPESRSHSSLSEWIEIEIE